MSYGVCSCVTGPPPGGRCMACGIVGQPVFPLPYTPAPVVTTPNTVPIVIREVGASPEEVRRIVREEIAAAFARERQDDQIGH